VNREGNCNPYDCSLDVHICFLDTSVRVYFWEIIVNGMYISNQELNDDLQKPHLVSCENILQYFHLVPANSCERARVVKQPRVDITSLISHPCVTMYSSNTVKYIFYFPYFRSAQQLMKLILGSQPSLSTTLPLQQ